MSYQLVGYPLCPFVQRVLITLNHKGIDYELTWLNPHEPLPDWFKEWSPLGRVPVMKVPSGEVLFESMAIVEYLEEAEPKNSLYPADLAEKALSRAWAGVAGELYGPQYLTMIGKTEAEVTEAFTNLKATLAILETEAEGAKSFFNSDAMSAIDLVLAPMFARFDIVESQGGENPLADYPKLSALKSRLLADPAIKPLLTDEWRESFIANQKNSGGYYFQ